MNKEEKIGVGVGIGITAISAAVVYFVKTKGKKKEKKIMEDLEILDESLKHKSWWLTKECQNRTKNVISMVREKIKGTDELKSEFEIIDTKHWMTKEYQEAAKTIFDWARNKKEGKN